MRIGYSEDYTDIMWKDIKTYIKYYVFDNDLFVVGNHQKKDIVIGGIILVPLAELFYIGKELQFLSQSERIRAGQQVRFFFGGGRTGHETQSDSTIASCIEPTHLHRVCCATHLRMYVNPHCPPPPPPPGGGGGGKGARKSG